MNTTDEQILTEPCPASGPEPGIRVQALLVAWLVALFGTAGSLIFSEILHFIPCNLCWYQRICLYPLVIILGIAVYREERGIALYTFPLAVIGGLISLYQVMEQHIGALSKVLPCTVGVPCNHQYIDWLGFITIPLLSCAGFVLLSCFLWLARKPAA